MVLRVPFLKVSGPDTGNGAEDMLLTWGSRLIGVRLIDRTDGESDEAIFMFTRKPPYVPLPGDGTPYTVSLGWSRTDVAIGGVYTFQRAHIFGEPGQGQQQHLICRAGDLADTLKQTDSQHFDKDNGHKTLGDVFQSLLKGGGTVNVHPDIAKIPLPGEYALRWNQSRIDMAQQLAEENGGYVKPSGGGIAIVKRGAGQSVSGQDLPTIAVPFDGDYSFDVELEPRFAYAEASATYLDKEKGTLERETGTAPGGGGKGTAALPHPAPDKESAKAYAEAAAAETARFAAVGLFTKVGDPAAVSEAPVKPSGFGSDIDNVPWSATTVTQEVEPGRGWLTIIETESAAGRPTGG